MTRYIPFLSSVLLLQYNAFSTKMIQNGNVPVCRNCIHYLPPEYGPFSSMNGRCNLFGEKDIVTGEIEYHTARESRRHETKCGERGVFFQEEPNVRWKVIRDYIDKNHAYLFLCLMIPSLLIINIVSMQK